MEIFNQIIENPLYMILFGSGGVLIIIITLISMRGKREGGVNINIDVNNQNSETICDVNSDETENKDYHCVFNSEPLKDTSEEYDFLDFKTEEYYITYLKTIEEKKKAGDKFEFK